ncbi:MAG: hypothetical protein HY960_13805 [Ignavibacteriae bacterium]|nr:hypothetical protein [Ignavibacteriota bacterium]
MKYSLYCSITLFLLLIQNTTYGQPPVYTLGGNSNYVPKFTSSTTPYFIGNSSIFDINGKVGFGTTNPQNIIDVEGGVAIGSTYSGTIVAPSNGLIVEGNTGIGTSSPGYNLDGLSSSRFLTLDASSNDPIFEIARNTSSTNYGNGQIDFINYHNTTYKRLAYIQALTNGTSTNKGGHLRFFTKNDAGTNNGLERMRITSDGNIGIGTVNPLSTLTVTSNITSPNAVLSVTNSNTSSNVQTYALKVTGGQVINTGMSPASYGVYVQGGGAANSGSNSYGLYVLSGSGTGGNYAAYFGGNVGIGTINPTQKLDVAGTVKMTGFNLSSSPSAGYVLTSDASGNGTWQAPTGGSGSLNGTTNYLAKFTGINSVGNSVMFENAGYVGIGSTSPTQKLHVYGETNTRMLIEAATEEAELNLKSGSKMWSFYAGGNNLYWYSDDSPSGNRMTLTSSGNLGIGTDVPKNKLDIEGALAIGSAYSGTNVAPTNGLLVEGNVGIGTTNPTAKLQIENNNSKWFQGFAVKNGTNTGGRAVLLISGGANNFDCNSNPTSCNYLSSEIILEDKFHNEDGRGITGTREWHIFHDNSNGLIFQKAENYGGYTSVFSIGWNGNIGIGTTPATTTKLAVEGTIGAREVNVTIAGTAFPDYVFDEDYKILPLNELEQHIKEQKHLPEIPTAEDVKKNGLNLGEMQVKLLKKIEELTLYVINQEKKLTKLEKENSELQKRVNGLDNQK